MSNEMIHVTKTYMPSKEKYQKHVDDIFESAWITNNGSKLQELEKRLADYLGVKNLILVSNGTVALEIAYRTLGIKDFAITTPFSFVATTSSLVTNDIKPIFVDIDKNSYNIDATKIEDSITKNTSAIVPVHVFGNPCDVEKIDEIAKKHDLKVVYDAAHAFDVKYKGESVLNWGDISTLSFHATKLFHTIEGGALIINDDELVQKARYLINFGIQGPESIPELGTNAKMNEFEAAMGLCVLDEIENIKQGRKKVVDTYISQLEGYVKFQEINADVEINNSYFPIVLKSEEQLLKVQEALNDESIFPRRYFYPSLDTLDYIEPKQNMPISRDISKRILCLPIHVDLEKKIQDRIINIIKKNCKTSKIEIDYE